MKIILEIVSEVSKCPSMVKSPAPSKENTLKCFGSIFDDQLAWTNIENKIHNSIIEFNVNVCT